MEVVLNCEVLREHGVVRGTYQIILCMCEKKSEKLAGLGLGTSAKPHVSGSRAAHAPDFLCALCSMDYVHKIPWFGSTVKGQWVAWSISLLDCWNNAFSRLQGLQREVHYVSNLQLYQGRAGNIAESMSMLHRLQADEQGSVVLPKACTEIGQPKLLHGIQAREKLVFLKVEALGFASAELRISTLLRNVL